ncbi:hypothetical protein [Prauserella marina]|uniref:hypothetical protein n=1 Tax=Prauserella marina TaxID=530584 RepID=UPI001476522C|nr:hypothetical protein [Prauserella marina]
MVKIVEQLQRFGDIGDINPEPEFRRRLTEGFRSGFVSLQTGPRQLVHRLAQPDVPLATKLFRCCGDVLIKAYRCPHSMSLHH